MSLKYIIFSFLTCISFMGCHSTRTVNLMDNEEQFLTLLVGTYTRGESQSKGIYIYNFNLANGEVTYKGLAEVPNPSYFTVSTNHEFLYVVSEGKEEGALVSSFQYNKPDKELKKINTVAAAGNAPCYIIYDEKNRFVVTSNYSGANVGVHPVLDDGSVGEVSQVIPFTGTGPDPDRQKQAHPHCAYFSRDSNYIYVPDLGIDCLHKFKIDGDAVEGKFLVPGEPSEYKVLPGSGPRHLIFHPSNPVAYLINELSGVVDVFRYADGELEQIQSIVSDTVHAAGSADIHVSCDGRFLYTSNRLKNDGITIFEIDPESDLLTFVGYQRTGDHPRNFVLTPDGQYLLVACRDSDMVQIFARNKENGLLEDTGHRIELEKPVCLKWI